MSAPDTNIEKQKDRHKGPLTGMAAMVASAVVLLVIMVMVLSMRGEDPSVPGSQIEEGIGGAELAGE